ncbi:MAG: alkaline phosphatase family protein [Solobacterium sp.]|nr:alkaline phosphatase family protein [Solobacterium sp.]
MRYTDFDRYGGIVEAGAALRKYYGLETEWEGDPDLLEWLDRGSFRCVVVLLIDAMGTSILDRYGDPDGFFRKNMKKQIMTVFPPTTTAAVTSLLTGKYPKQNAWLGWNQYFHETDDNIILFRNTGQYSDIDYSGFTDTHLPVKPVYDELNENGIPAETVWPAWSAHNACADFHELCEKTLAAAGDPDIRFIYAYWDALDSFMHKNGPEDPGTGEMIRMLEKETAVLAEHLPADCGLLVTADHSQISVTHYSLDSNRELCGCFRHKPAIEGRACAFYIREDRREKFEQLFQEELGDQFELYTHEDVNRLNIFGKGKAHPRFEEFTGDYLAVAAGSVQLDYMKKKDMKGNHAGGLPEEAQIPLILFPQEV